MGSQWDAELPAQAIWDECFRVLKPGGHVFVMSSERLGCVAGLYMSLRKAGFEVDETQLLNWVSLTGMPKSVDVGKVADKEAFRAWLAMHRETVTCPDHKEPKDPETGKRQRCVECERIFVEGKLTRHDQRKAESAAVNGMYFPPTHRAGNEKGNAHGPAYNWASAEGGVMGHEERSDACALLTRLLASHWPTSPAEQRAHWEACVAEVPEEWDCSRPPGVRVKTGRNPRASEGRSRMISGQGLSMACKGRAEESEPQPHNRPLHSRRLRARRPPGVSRPAEALLLPDHPRAEAVRRLLPRELAQVGDGAGGRGGLPNTFRRA